MWNRTTARTAYFLLLMSLLGSGETSRPDAMVNGDPTSASEPSNGPSNDQTPVARLLGKPVYHKDCKSPSYGIGSVEVGFHHLILSVLAQDFCENKGVKLTKDETDAFVERCKMAARKLIQAQRERIERELASPNLALKKKRELEHRKEKLPADGVPLTPPPFDRQKEQEKLVAIRRQLDAPNLAWLERFALEGKERTQLVRIEHQSRFAAMAHAQLTPLRCKQALYNRYSGKVVGRQLGIQPIGAQYKLVQEAEKNGKLAFLDEGLKQAFWKRMDNAMRLPTLPARLIDFTWPVWLTDDALNNLFFQKARGAENQKEHELRYQIALVSRRNGQRGIFVMELHGSTPQRLTTGRLDLLPSWSPDGKKIAFMSLREHDMAINAKYALAFHFMLYVMDANGKNQKRLTKTPVGMIFRWAPNGKRILFQSSYEDVQNKGKDGILSSAVYVMDRNGTNQRRLTPIEANDVFPSWSPDGKQIVFCSNRSGNMEVYVMNADGTSQRRLTNNAGEDMFPLWSPDGKRIAFASNRGMEKTGTYVMNTDGTNLKNTATEGRPIAWSPDSKRLLLSSSRDGLHIIDSNGQNMTKLTTNDSRALDGAFSPAGRKILYRSKGNVFAVDLDGRNRKNLSDDSGNITGFSLSPAFPAAR